MCSYIRMFLVRYVHVPYPIANKMVTPVANVYIFGGMSCMAAACVTNPIDVLKVCTEILKKNGC